MHMSNSEHVPSSPTSPFPPAFILDDSSSSSLTLDSSGNSDEKHSSASLCTPAPAPENGTTSFVFNEKILCQEKFYEDGQKKKKKRKIDDSSAEGDDDNNKIWHAHYLMCNEEEEQSFLNSTTNDNRPLFRPHSITSTSSRENRSFKNSLKARDNGRSRREEHHFRSPLGHAHGHHDGPVPQKVKMPFLVDHQIDLDTQDYYAEWRKTKGSFLKPRFNK